MQIDPATLGRRESYQWLIACLVPRPIAWLTTKDDADTVNLAPFSFFGGVTSDPMTVMVSIGRRRDGQAKDTARNLLGRGEGVVHIPTLRDATAMVGSSADLPPHESEVEALGLALTPSAVVAVPRLAGAALALEARVQSHTEVGRGPVDLFLLEIVQLHADDAVLVDGLPDPARLAALGRLGGASYCTTASPFAIARP
jgi:flavin reductase (DIM6/NTAB) family NADH-FMN oxidoreductase RutF